MWSDLYFEVKRFIMYKLKNKFRQLFLTAATVGAACLLAGCGVGASAAEAGDSGAAEGQSDAGEQSEFWQFRQPEASGSSYNFPRIRLGKRNSG